MSRKRELAYQTEKNPFSTRLREIMEECKTTQKQLADAIGKRPQTVSLYMNGQSLPDALTLKKMTDFFGISADWILGRDGAVKTMDADIAAAVRCTGLTEDAVELLARRKEKALLPAASSFNELFEICEDLPEYFNETRNVISSLLVSGCAIQIAESITMYKIAAKRLRDILQDVDADSVLKMDNLKRGQLIDKITELNTLRRMRKYDAKESASAFVDDAVKTDSELCESAFKNASLQTINRPARPLSLDEFVDIMRESLEELKENQNGEHNEADN